MITEAAAREKWCPFARVIVETDAKEPATAANRMPGIGGCPDPDLEWPSPRCIGSECMAWRDGGEQPDQKRRAEDEYRRTGRRLDVERVGFCGLAGRPEPRP